MHERKTKGAIKSEDCEECGMWVGGCREMRSDADRARLHGALIAKRESWLWHCNRELAKTSKYNFQGTAMIWMGQWQEEMQSKQKHFSEEKQGGKGGKNSWSDHHQDYRGKPLTPQPKNRNVARTDSGEHHGSGSNSREAGTAPPGFYTQGSVRGDKAARLKGY